MSAARTLGTAIQVSCRGCEQAKTTHGAAEAQVFSIDKPARCIHRDYRITHPKQRLARRCIHQMWQPTFERGMAVCSLAVHVITGYAQAPGASDGGENGIEHASIVVRAFDDEIRPVPSSSRNVVHRLFILRSPKSNLRTARLRCQIEPRSCRVIAVRAVGRQTACRVPV